MKIWTGFTSRTTRARHGRGWLLMGKTGLICNVFCHELPRSAWLPVQVAVTKLEVRTGVLQEIPFFLLRARICQNSGLFAAVYEPDGRFEPVVRRALRGADFVGSKLPVGDEPITSGAVFIEGDRLREIRFGESLNLAVNGGCLSAKLGGLELEIGVERRFPRGEILNEPIGSVVRERKGVERIGDVVGDKRLTDVGL